MDSDAQLRPQSGRYLIQCPTIAKDEDIVNNETSEVHHAQNTCHDGSQCDAFQRLQNNGYCSDDIEHCSKCFHVSGRGGTTISENFGSRKFVTAYQNWGVDLPKGTGLWNGIVEDGDLMQELERYGFSDAMNVNSGPHKSLNDVVIEKLNHSRHQQMGSPLTHDQMLAILLYTDSNVYTDLRHHEMCYSKQDFANTQPCDLIDKKWPILGCLLNSAIWTLDQHDIQPRPAVVYHGLCAIEIDPSTFNNHNWTKQVSTETSPVFRYGTFISTSSDRQVARDFMSGKGSLLEISLEDEDDDVNVLVGADVSWISKYSWESEFLVARNATFVIQSMTFSEQDNCQIVKVKHGPISHNRAKFRHLYG